MRVAAGVNNQRNLLLRQFLRRYGSHSEFAGQQTAPLLRLRAQWPLASPLQQKPGQQPQDTGAHDDDAIAIARAIFLVAVAAASGSRQQTSSTRIAQKAVENVNETIAHELLEHNKGSANLVLLGIPTRGVALARRLADVDYLVDESLATSMFLSARLPQPLLLEGEAGVGKTEAAKALAAVLDTPLIRLQCYEGIDAAEALYEWNYPRQLLSIRLADSTGAALSEDDLFGPDYLIRRPLLQALEHPGPRPAVLLIDEIDRADDDFEAFLLELLAEASVTIPEIGTIAATHPPLIVLTSNRTRDLHDAVKRRCLYHWIGYPSSQRAVEIVRRRVKGASQMLAVQVADAVSRMRESDVQKPPGIAEAIDWLSALDLLGVERLDAAVVARTLGSVLKYGEDQDVVRAAGLENLVSTGD